MWEGSLHCRIKRRKPATMLGLGGEKKRKAIGGLEISLEEREGRAFKWLARASSSLLDKNTGMSVVDGWFNCGPAYGWHVRVLSLSGSSDSCLGPFPVKYEEIAASETVWLFCTSCRRSCNRHSTGRRRERSARRIRGNHDDWRDRPTAKEPLEDEWFKEDGEEGEE
jgi:hypothetical protein